MISVHSSPILYNIHTLYTYTKRVWLVFIIIIVSNISSILVWTEIIYRSKRTPCVRLNPFVVSVKLDMYVNISCKGSKVWKTEIEPVLNIPVQDCRNGYCRWRILPGSERKTIVKGYRCLGIESCISGYETLSENI